MRKVIHGWTRAALVAAALAIASTADAQKGRGSGAPLSAAGGTSTSAPLVPMATFTDFTFDVAGIFSVDGQGDADNEVFNVNIGANRRVIGIGWNVTQFADAPSFLSEMVVGFGSSTTGFVNLTTAIGDDFSGTASYNSGGVQDLIGLGLDFNVLANGILRLEFFETFDDFANDWDGRWESGALTIRVETPSTVVPEPSTYALLATGLVTLTLVARRRRA